jgi:DNA-binding NarL/FixJ family response regulator
MEHLSGAIKAGSVDVVLLGSSRIENSFSAIPLLESLLGRHEALKVIVLSQDPDYAEVISFFGAGAKGLVSSEDLKFDLLCKSIRCVFQGQIWASNKFVRHMASSLAGQQTQELTDAKGKPLLTKREQQVLHLLAEGLSNQQLAAELKLSEHTVKNHLFRIYDKLGVSSRTEAVLYSITPRRTLPQSPALKIVPGQKKSA